MASWKDVRNYVEAGEPIAPIPEGVEMIPVVGVSFVEGYPSTVHKLAEIHLNRQREVMLRLVRNPDNPYDGNAIEVHFGDQMLGHIPKEVAARIAPIMDSGQELTATLYQVRISPENPNNPGLDILLEGGGPY